MGLVERVEHIPMTLLRPVNLSELFGDVRPQKQVAAIYGEIFSAQKTVSCPGKVSALAGDDADVAMHLTPPRRLFFRSNVQQRSS